MSPPDGLRLSVAQAAALGLMHGPAELLPISSSGHVVLVPRLLGWEYPQLDGELRKAFEVALHAGTAAALLIALRGEVADAAQGLNARRIALIAGSFLPPAVAGLAFERRIEQRLGTEWTVAVGLAIGGAFLAIADRAPQRRRREDAGAFDGLTLGLAQACALVPGLSRNGMTLGAARLRGFHRRDANVLSRHVALPVIAGATVLKGSRLARRGLPPELRAPFAAGITASFASTLAAAGGGRSVERDGPLWPFAAYRAGLAGLAVWRMRGPVGVPSPTAPAPAAQ